MNIKYVFTLDVPPQKAWEVLTDIPSITPCMPGASLDGQDEKGYKGKMRVKLGPIDMVFNGHIRFVERDDVTQNALLEAAATEAKGAGNAKATITFQVRQQAGGSEVTVDSEYAVSGKAAQFGGGVMQSVGKRLMDEFAKRVREKIAKSGYVPAIESAQPEAASSLASANPAYVAEDHVSASQAPGNEALDLIGLTWRPLLARGAVVLVALAVAYGIWRYMA